MRFRPLLLSRLICVCLAIAIALPFISWLTWSFGLPVASLFEPEGLRWLCVGSISQSFNAYFFICVMFSSALGVWQRALSHPTIADIRRRAVLACVLTAIFMLTVASFAVFRPDSPLLSINGTLANSPFSRGFVPFFLLSVIELGALFGFIVGNIRSLDSLVDAIVHGVRKYAAWLLFFFLVSFDYSCIAYVLQDW